MTSMATSNEKLKTPLGLRVIEVFSWLLVLLLFGRASRGRPDVVAFVMLALAPVALAMAIGFLKRKQWGWWLARCFAGLGAALALGTVGLMVYLGFDTPSLVSSGGSDWGVLIYFLVTVIGVIALAVL